jgi:hypothetical protein
MSLVFPLEPSKDEIRDFSAFPKETQKKEDVL